MVGEAPVSAGDEVGRMPKHLTFTAWLLQRRGEETAFGELARRVAADAEWVDPQSLGALESTLQGAGCSQAVMQTARRAWQRYLADAGTARAPEVGPPE